MRKTSGAKKVHKVSSTSRVFFDEDFNTFRLYAGNSLYAFCISPELSLEHLYFGASLPPGYDLRYLSQSSRNAHFNTVEAAPDSFQGRIVLEAETLEEVQQTWKESIVKASHQLDDVEILQKRRMENYAWRILSKATQQGRLTEVVAELPANTARSMMRTSSRSDMLQRSADTSTKSSGKAGIRKGVSMSRDAGDVELPVPQDAHSFKKAMRAGAVSTGTHKSGSGGVLPAVNSNGSGKDVSNGGGVTGTDIASGSQKSTTDTTSTDLSTVRRRSNSAPYRQVTGAVEDDTLGNQRFSEAAAATARIVAADPSAIAAAINEGTSGGDKDERGIGLSLSSWDLDTATPPTPSANMEQYIDRFSNAKANQSMTHLPAAAAQSSPNAGFAMGAGKGPSATTANMLKPSISRGTILDILNEERAKSKRSARRHAHQTFDRSVGKMGKGLLCVEYADHGTGDYRSPSFMVVDNFNGSNISPLRYRRHAIYRGKLEMPDSLPAIRCLNEREASTLVVTMGDANTGLEVDLIYVAMHDYDAITRRAVFRNVDHRPRRFVDGDNVAMSCNYPAAAAAAAYSNTGAGAGGVSSSLSSKEGQAIGNSKVIQKASSMTIDFEAAAAPFYLIQLSGSWGRERYKVETELHPGSHSFGSVRGVSGHVHNPFAAVTSGTPSEHHGEVKGFSLIYSGNFLVETEISEMGRLRMNMGIHHMSLQWNLKHGTSFNTPEAVLVRSGEGMGGMSRAMHRLFMDRLLPRNWSDVDPPILLNSWEAKYFHVNHDNIVDMARQAAPLGINMIVLDDGWFGKRANDESSLGDWVASAEKFPHGMRGLAEEVNALGCKLGLWFEPEMVSEDSLLFALHPDWYLHVPGRPRQLSRNQMVLDMSREDVRDYLFHSIATILSTANIEYIKWDMNRPLTEVYSAAAHVGEVWQAEVSHRYVLGVYDLMGKLTSTFPHVLLENCASGGGRFDPGMLYYSPQIWCSDNTDALTRMRVQYGTSFAYPARCIGAHVSTVPNHITGSTTRLRTRGFVAMCGTFGFELDLQACPAKDQIIFRQQIELYKQISPIIRWGDLYRLWDPFKGNLAAWMYVTRDRNHAIVFAFSINSDHWSNLVPRLTLKGLWPDAEYEVSEPVPNNITQQNGNLMIIETEVPVYQLGVNNVCLTGDMLMQAGLPLKFFTLDDSHCFVLTRVSDGAGAGAPIPTAPNVPATGMHVASGPVMGTTTGFGAVPPGVLSFPPSGSAPHLAHLSGAAASMHTGVRGSSSYSTLQAFQNAPGSHIYGPPGGIAAFGTGITLDTIPIYGSSTPPPQSSASMTSSGGGSSGSGLRMTRSRNNSKANLWEGGPVDVPVTRSRSRSGSRSGQGRDAQHAPAVELRTTMATNDSFDNLYMPMGPAAEITMPLKPDPAIRSSSDNTW